MAKNYYDARTYSPHKKRRKKRHRFLNPKSLLIIFIFIIVIVGGVFVTSSDMFNIESVEVENNQISVKEEIIARSGIVMGENIYSFSARKASSDIEQIPIVEKAKIHRKFPSTVVIEITEKSPYFILQKGNEYYDIDDKGKVMSVSESLSRYDVPIVTGINIKDIEESKNIFDLNDVRLDTLKSVFDFLKENEVINKVSQFYIDKSGKYNLYFSNGSVLQFSNFSAFSYHKSFILYFIKNMDMKQKVELIQGVNPIYSKI